MLNRLQGVFLSLDKYEVRRLVLWCPMVFLLGGLVAGALLWAGGLLAVRPKDGQGAWLPRSVRGFQTPDPATWHEIMPAVWSYLYYRKQAVLQGDIRVLWRVYPELAQGMDGVRGINAEALLVQGFRDAHPVDGNIALDSVGRIHRKGATEVEVYLHGSELYLLRDESGRLFQSGGELMLTLSLRKQGGRWAVYRTDEVTEAEVPGELP